MSKKKTLPLELVSTGNQYLDEILGGGIPARSVVVVAGEPGSGKTILTLEVLFKAAQRGKKGLYLTTLSEPAVKLIGYMQHFDFFDVELVDKQVIFADLGAALRESPETALEALSALVEKHEPSFVAIDSVRALVEQLGARARPFVYELAVQMAGWGATTLLVGEYTRSEIATATEFAIADGIVRLGSQPQELTSVRELEVLKLRGAAYVSGRHFFEIDSSGVSFYPRVRTPGPADRETPIEADPASTGVQGLDELIDGGLPRASSTIVEGGTGTGKTLLGLQFLIEGARRGERGLLFTQEETPEQLRRIARGFGWDLADLEKQRLLTINYTSPVEMSTDRYLSQTRAEVEALGARRAVFDSLTTLSLGVSSDRRFKEMIYAITKHMRQAGVSLLMTVETEQLLGSAVLSGHGVSFMADNLIQLRYVEMDGRLERAISVLKARGVKHSTELRSLSIEAGGAKVTGDRFKDLRGVLTGLPARARKRR